MNPTLLDLPVELTVCYGETTLPVSELLKLGPNDIVEMDRMMGEPVDLRIGNRTVARGEIMLAGEQFVVSITEVVSATAPARQKPKRS